MDKYDTSDAVTFALTGKPVEFQNSIHQLLGGKLQDAIEARREEIAKYIYNPTDAGISQEEDPAKVEETPDEE